MFRSLLVGLLTGLWLSLEEAHCQDLDKDVETTTLCYNTSSGNTCFTTFIAKDSLLVRNPFEAASDLCSSTAPGSALIRINSLEGRRIVDDFIGIQELLNETIVIDAQRITGNSLRWSWINGHPTVPKGFNNEAMEGLDGACVESKHDQSITYCTGTQQTQNRYICEYSDSRPTFSHRHNRRYYFASNASATWYDARNECLRLGGDLASITDLNMAGNRSWLNINARYWIGFHRNKWIWNSTGAALTYTNWKGGYHDVAADDRCICIEPQCNGTICVKDRKWNICDCGKNYAVVCHKDENFNVSTTKNVVTEVMLTSTSRSTSGGNHSTGAASETTNSSTITSATTPNTTNISTESPIVTSPSTTSTSTKTPTSTTPLTTSTSIKIATAAVPFATTPSNKTPTDRPTTSLTTSTSSKIFTAAVPFATTPSTETSIDTTPITAATSTKEAIVAAPFTESPSTALFESFGKQEILIVVLLLVAIIFIVVAVIVVIRKRRVDKRNATSPTENTKQDETVTSEYATVVPGNKPPEVTTQAASPTYAEVQMAQNPKPSSNPNAEVTPNPTPSNTTYAEVQMTQQPAPSNTTYAEVTQRPTPSDNTYAEVQMTKQPGPTNTTYAEVTHQPAPSNNTYAEVVMTQQPAPSNSHIYANFQPTTTNEAADMSSGVVYAGLDFSHPNSKAVDEPIYLQAMDVKPEAGSGEDDVATQDLGPVYAELMKLKKSD